VHLTSRSRARVFGGAPLRVSLLAQSVQRDVFEAASSSQSLRVLEQNHLAIASLSRVQQRVLVHIVDALVRRSRILLPPSVAKT